MRTIILSGPPGVGKSSVGRRLSAMLELPFVDSDEVVAAKSGRSVAELIRAEGEAAFRAREAAVVNELLDDAAPRVIALGGGSVTDRALRHRALDRGLLVTLRAGEAKLRERITTAGDAADRPLLGSGGSALVRLLELRRAAYAECHLSIESDELSLDETVDAIAPWIERHLIAVPLGERTYSIELVRSDPTRVVDRMAALGASSMIVVTDAHIRRAQGKLLDAMLAPLTLPRFDVVLAAGEAQKTLGTVATIWDAALGAGIDREAVVFGFGGGVVLDLAGFAAATLLRGLRWLAAPTTLLAMVDASVGGKTGFDHPAGKNLVGAFHQPSAVVADFATLATLPIRERRAGLAEVVKIALAYDAALFQRMEETAEALRDGDDGALFPVVSAAILAKTRVVRADEREHGERVILNLGHTVGHALEAHGGFTRWLHGEAVALGVVAELRAAAALGLGDATIATRTQRLLARLGLPSEPKDLSRDELAAALRWADADKKRRGTHLRLPVIQSLGASSTAPVELERLKSEILRT